MWYIPDDQVTKIQNRMSDIRSTPVTEAVNFIAATYELLGTLDTVLFDQRNWERKNKSTMILAEDKDVKHSNNGKKNINGTQSKVLQALNADKNKPVIKPVNTEDKTKATDTTQPEKKMNSHERRKERRRLEREAAKAEADNTEKKDDGNKDDEK